LQEQQFQLHSAPPNRPQGSGILASTLQRSIRDTDANGDQSTAKEVSALRALIDPSAVPLNDDVQFLIDGEDAQRAPAGGLTRAAKHRGSGAADVETDLTAERLRQLSDEVSRIAAVLARLSTDPGAAARPVEEGRVANIPEVSAETIRTVISARRLRTRFFPEELFADPAWDMLLDLLQAEVSQFRVSVSGLCAASAVPMTTALRWVTALVEQGLFVRRTDPHDGRRVFVELTPKTSHALRCYFAEVGQVAVI
jgi:hypothetical protein